MIEHNEVGAEASSSSFRKGVVCRLCSSVEKLRAHKNLRGAERGSPNFLRRYRLVPQCHLQVDWFHFSYLVVSIQLRLNTPAVEINPTMGSVNGPNSSSPQPEIEKLYHGWLLEDNILHYDSEFKALKSTHYSTQSAVPSAMEPSAGKSNSDPFVLAWFPLQT